LSSDFLTLKGLDEIYSFGSSGQARGCLPVRKTESMPWSPSLYHRNGEKLSPDEHFNLNPHFIHKFPSHFKYNCPMNKTTVFPHGSEIASFLTSYAGRKFHNLE